MLAKLYDLERKVVGLSTYDELLKLNIDLSVIGLQMGLEENNYFCTPKGARIIGRSGVDGIHFCFVRGFGKMVFQVSPMNLPGSYVHPVARDFEDFLRLLLACGHTAAIEQAWNWDQEQFDKFLRTNDSTNQQAAVRNTLREELLLTPMENPFTYIKALQDGFDYGTIPYTKDYYEVVPIEDPIPSWKVYFEGNFWGGSGRGERAGEEKTLNKNFYWQDETWTIPAIYTSSKGLIIDFCLQVPPERISAFMDKWNLSADDNGGDYTDEQRMQIEAENPLAVDINPKVVLNGIELTGSHGSGLSWNPCLAEGKSPEAWSVIQHYELDPEQGYMIWRQAFLWKTKRRPQIKTLSLRVERERVSIPGPHFQVSLPGEQFEFVHPSTGKRHTLTVQDNKQQELSGEHFNNPNLEFPRHFTMMSYTLSPDLADQAFTITDSVRGDRPRHKQVDSRAPQTTGDVGCVAILGGSDGPNAIFFVQESQGKLRAACSSMHFKSVQEVEWRMIFYEKTHADVMVELI